MQSKGVSYILGFCTAVCLVCSVFVSISAVGLKQKQEENKQLDRQKKVLVVAGLLKEGAYISAKQVPVMFKKRIKAVIVDLKSGAVDAKATEKADTFDQLKASKDPKTSTTAPKNLAGVGRIPNKGLVYLVSQKDMGDKGEGFVLQKYILPIEGKGLWSTLYGFIALAPDFNKVEGLTFYQHAETPGLGGEVDNPSWKAKWPNRLVFGPQDSQPSTWKQIRLSVIKGQAGPPTQDPHRVDGLSGATITSNGVTYLIHFWLGPQGFGKFIQNQRKGTKLSSVPTQTSVPTRMATTPRTETPQPLVRQAVIPTHVPVVRQVSQPPVINRVIPRRDVAAAHIPANRRAVENAVQAPAVPRLQPAVQPQPRPQLAVQPQPRPQPAVQPQPRPQPAVQPQPRPQPAVQPQPPVVRTLSPGEVPPPARVPDDRFIPYRPTPSAGTTVSPVPVRAVPTSQPAHRTR